MKDEFENDLGMGRRVQTYLNDPANKTIWFNQPPLRFTQRAAQLDTDLGNFGSLGASQSVGMKGSAAQQNLYETKLEDVAFPLSNALHEYYLDNNAADQAAEWDLPLTLWRRMREQSLLGKAARLLTQMTVLTSALPPKGSDHGITAAAVTALEQAIDDYSEAIGKPTARRAQRSVETKSLRPTWRTVRDNLEAMDKLVAQFPAPFPAGWSAVRRIDDAGHGPGKPSTPPPSPTP